MLDIKGSVAVITGGGGGIGFSIAKYWVKNGGRVVIADISDQLLDKAAAKSKRWAARSSLWPAMLQREDCARLADTAIEAFGRSISWPRLPASSRTG